MGKPNSAAGFWKWLPQALGTEQAAKLRPIIKKDKRLLNELRALYDLRKELDLDSLRKAASKIIPATAPAGAGLASIASAAQAGSADPVARMLLAAAEGAPKITPSTPQSAPGGMRAFSEMLMGGPPTATAAPTPTAPAPVSPVAPVEAAAAVEPGVEAAATGLKGKAADVMKKVKGAGYGKGIGALFTGLALGDVARRVGRGVRGVGKVDPLEELMMPLQQQALQQRMMNTMKAQEPSMYQLTMNMLAGQPIPDELAPGEVRIGGADPASEQDVDPALMQMFMQSMQ